MLGGPGPRPAHPAIGSGPGRDVLSQLRAPSPSHVASSFPRGASLTRARFPRAGAAGAARGERALPRGAGMFWNEVEARPPTLVAANAAESFPVRRFVRVTLASVCTRH